LSFPVHEELVVYEARIIGIALGVVTQPIVEGVKDGFYGFGGISSAEQLKLRVHVVQFE